jgi:hypothetical protein
MDPNINRDSDKMEYSTFDFQKEQQRAPIFLRITRNA